MATTMRLPELGENVEAAEVVKILVAVGDRVERDQPVIEVETEKASVEVPATVAGTITQIHVAEGDRLASGGAILTVDEVAADGPGRSGEDAAAPRREPDDPWPEHDAGAESGGSGAASLPAEASPGPASDRDELSGEAGESSDEELVVRLPDLGENIDGADVVTVLVAVGDRIAAGQGLVEVETEKASVEVPSDASGVITEIHIRAGDRVVSGASLVSLRGARQPRSTPSPGPAPRADAPTSEPASDRPERAPSPGPTESAGTPPADPRRRGETVAPMWAGSPGPARRVPAAPTVRRFAREVGIDISEVRGSGAGGRISIEDVKEHVKHRLVRSDRGAVPVPQLPDFSRWGEVSYEPMTSVRRLTAETMARAWSVVPQVTQHDVADITELEELRSRYRARVEAHGGKLTLTAILVRVAASALRVHPQFNASIDVENQRIVVKHSVHVGVAVETERGLLVPVIRDADRKSIAMIARELDDLATRARSRKITPDEMQGATFTISNLGGIGGTGFSPIVSWPEVAILGVARARTQPEWRDDRFVPRLMVPLSLSYDHRLIDGADAARFTRWIAEALERPLLMVLEG